MTSMLSKLSVRLGLVSRVKWVSRKFLLRTGFEEGSEAWYINIRMPVE